MPVRREMDDRPIPEVHSEWQLQQVLKARSPQWLRARAAGCLAIDEGTWRKHDPEHTNLNLRYAHLRDPNWLVLEAERCETRADAIERGEQVTDWYVTSRGQIER